MPDIPPPPPNQLALQQHHGPPLPPPPNQLAQYDGPPPPNQLALQQLPAYPPGAYYPYPPPPFYPHPGAAPQAWQQPGPYYWQPQPPAPAPAPPQPQPQPPEVPPLQNAAARKRGAKAAKPRPNAEPRPGVFRFPVVVDTGDEKREFIGETDMPWDDFYDRVKAYLDGSPRPIKLVYKISGEAGKGINLTNADDFAAAMNRVCDKADHARTKTVSIDVKNATKAPAPKKGKGKGKKRAREDDDLLDTPGADDPESDSQLKAYKRLEPAIRCEAHQGHCFVSRQGGQDNHRRLSHGEMTLWAKKISLGEVTIYDPPHCMNFDRGPAKRPRNSKPPPQVHVTINTIESSVTSTASTPLSSITREATPIEPSSSTSLSARTESQDLDERRLAAVQDLTRPPKSAPGQVAYPHISLVLALLDVDMPQHRFRDVQQSLLNMGIDDACKLLLLPQDCLSQIGGIGAERAHYLHMYAGYGVAPVLGMQRPVRQAHVEPGPLPAAEVPQALGDVNNNPDDDHQDEDEDEDEGDEVDELED